jgi:hypothetical protein
VGGVLSLVVARGGRAGPLVRDRDTPLAWWFFIPVAAGARMWHLIQLH